MVREPALANQPEVLVTRLIFTELVHDAIMFGFASVTNVTREDFGSQTEMIEYADSMVAALASEQAVDFARVYLPLVMGGLIANGRVTMPREQIRETVFILAKALEKRQPERSGNNAFIFDLTSSLIERALDSI